MPLSSFEFASTLVGGGTSDRAVDLASVLATFAVGDGTVWPELATSFDLGTGDLQANQIFTDTRTVAATTNDDIDLFSGLTNVYNEAIVFTRIKWVIIDIDTPTTTKRLRVGPLAVANAFVGWMINAGGTTYEEIVTRVVKEHPYAGWTVSNVIRNLRIFNPGATAVTYRILIIGVQ